MSKTVTQNGYCPSFNGYSQDNEETLGSDEVILVVSKEIVSLSLGFAIDCGKLSVFLPIIGIIFAHLNCNYLE